MAKTFSVTSKTVIYFFLLAITLGCANSARILDEVESQPQIVANPPEAFDSSPITVPDVAPVAGPTTTLPSGQIPATAASPTVAGADAPEPEAETPDTTAAPVADVAPIAGPAPTLASGPNPVAATVAHADPPQLPEATVPNTVTAPVADVAPVTSLATPLPHGPAPVVAASSTVAHADPQHPPLSFFMHDILGGSHPSARMVTGIVSNTQINGLPFSKPNDGIFPIDNGVPLLNGNNNGILNNNNIPFITGLNNGAQTSTVIQNSGNNNLVNGGNTQPFVTAGQLPTGATLQKLMFGSITVIDDELTEGHELGSAVIGKAQGFYLASSLDGNSHTMALTVLFHGGGEQHDEEDTISFFGVHRTASPDSDIAIVGGTGKYENAKGYATIQSLHQEDQHTTDGVDTILQFNIYLSH
ncbi:hypothetical protein L1049_011968 [Liquidambar formosana]|uniref:Dirigent protein n=1 Tax=Liquidambar formosana TaxID=63359 RepID=A0AAP0X2S6_LIQFO